MLRFIFFLLFIVSFHVESTSVGVETPPLSRSSARQPCDKTPGLADANILALSWQPAFCETYGYRAGKPECRSGSQRQAQPALFSLHGFWPNQKACGIHYGFCGVASKRRHCDYDLLNLSPTVADALKQVMPSFAHGSCLERHEWFKHGSCQLLSADRYFMLAIKLLEEANNSQFVAYIQNHRGERIKKNALKARIREEYGDRAAAKFYLGCRKGMLVDVFIKLPAHIDATESLKHLIARASDYPAGDRCPKKIIISDFAA